MVLKRKIILIHLFCLLFITLAPLSSWSEGSACKMVEKIVSAPGMSNAKCIPLDFCLHWDMVSEHHYHGNFPSDKIHNVIEEGLSGYLLLIYNRQNKNIIDHFQVFAPSPQEKESIEAKLKSVNATYLRKHGSKTVTTKSVADYTVVAEPLRPLSFVYDMQDGSQFVEGDAPEVMASDPIMSRIRGAIYHEDMTSFRREGSEAVSVEDIKEGLKNSSLQKKFNLKKSMNYGAERFDRKGTMTADILFGVAVPKRWGKVNDPVPDPYCPNAFDNTTCFNVSVDCELSEIKITIKLQLIPGLEYIDYDITSAFQIQAHIDLYGNAIVGNLLTVTPDQMNDLKKKWKKEIEEVWNDKFRLKRKDGKGKPIKISFEVDFVDTPDACFVVTVMPQTGRSNVTTWYEYQSYGVASHEFGHMFGLSDEYSDQKLCPKRPAAKDDNIMKRSTSAKVKPRHSKPIADWVGKGGGSDWVPTK